MSMYTTGEIARLCGVTVRTVQYYDTRSILIPSELTEGGRRLYSEADVKRLKIICFLRELDLPLSAIERLLAEADPGSVIELLLEQQEKTLRRELEERQEKWKRLETLRRELKNFPGFSVDTLGDVAHKMENNRKLYRVRITMLLVGIVMDAIEIGTLVWWIVTGVWWPFAVGMPLVIAMAVWLSRFYFLKTKYICPECHSIFRPALREAFWARHTPNTRLLTCIHCGHHGFCVETFADEKTDV